ncbi:hypothetical protein SUGI_0277740 [Cryptomeria japonica]|nr:hypothetical protein SUGI_0277740 [Cryptomeria japonica]
MSFRNQLEISRKDKYEATKAQLKAQVKELQEYIMYLTKPVQQAKGSFAPPVVLPKKAMDELERMKATTENTQIWIRDYESMMPTLHLFTQYARIEKDKGNTVPSDELLGS